MKQRRKVAPCCPDCGSRMERFNPRNVDHVLARVPPREWACILRSPDLWLFAYVAIQSQDAPALAATVQLAGMRLQVAGRS